MENPVKQVAWMPGHLFTDGRRPAYASPKALKVMLMTTLGLRHRELQKLSDMVWHTDVIIHRMMRVEVKR